MIRKIYLYGNSFLTWVWLKIKELGLRRFSSFPFTKVPCWHMFWSHSFTWTRQLQAARCPSSPGFLDSDPNLGTAKHVFRCVSCPTNTKKKKNMERRPGSSSHINTETDFGFVLGVDELIRLVIV